MIVHDSFLLQANSCNNNYSRPIRLIFFNLQNNPYLKVKLTCFASISINLSQHHSHGLSTIIIVPIATLDNNVMQIWMNKSVRERISGVIRAITEDVVLSGFLISTILPVRLYCVVLFSRSYDSMGLDTKERCWSGRWKCSVPYNTRGTGLVSFKLFLMFIIRCYQLYLWPAGTLYLNDFKSYRT